MEAKEQHLELSGRLEMGEKSEVSKIMPRFLEKIRFAEEEQWVQFVIYDAFDSLLRC